VAPDLALRLERVEIVDDDHGQPGVELIETGQIVQVPIAPPADANDEQREIP